MQYLKTELHKQVYKVRRRSTVATKLDAPYTLLSIRGQASRTPVSSEVKGEELQAPNMHLQNFMPQEPSTATGTKKSTTSLVQGFPKVDEQRPPERNDTATTDVPRSLAASKSSKYEHKRSTLRNVNGFEAMEYLLEKKAEDEMAGDHRALIDEQEAQRLAGQGYMQAEQELAKYQKTKEEGGKLTGKEQRVKKLEASQAQSETNKENTRRVGEAKPLTGRHPKIPKNVARKIAERQEAKQAAKKATREENQGDYKLQWLASKTAKEAKWERSSEGKAVMMHQKSRSRAKTDDGSELTVRFTSQEQEPLRQVFRQSEAQDAPRITIKRHFSAGPDKYHQKHKATLEQRPHVEREPIAETKFFPPDDIKYGTRRPHRVSQDSLPIIREESEGKDPGTAYRGKNGNIFMLRRHPTMNPFERLQAIQQVGEITSRDQAMGLHSQYHLALFDKQPEDVRKS